MTDNDTQPGVKQETLEELQEQLAIRFQEWLDDPDMTAAQANVIRIFLKENGQLSTSRRRSQIYALSEAAKAKLPYDPNTHAG